MKSLYVDTAAAVYLINGENKVSHQDLYSIFLNIDSSWSKSLKTVTWSKTIEPKTNPLDKWNI